VVRVVLDANVFVSAAINPLSTPGLLFEKFLKRGRGGFELVITPRMVAEVQRALCYPRVRKRIAPPLRSEAWIMDLVALADVVSDSRLAAQVSRDSEDDLYIAAALKGRAQYVVTGDQDLLSVQEYQGVLFITPRFLLDLLER
jgi:putative PIN family toxin of toxin-antitoxin system